MKRLLIAALVALAAAVGPVGPVAAEAGKDDEAELLALVNNDRRAAGLPPVQMDGRLQTDARAWSEHVKGVAFEHDPGMPWYDCSLRSENVAYGQRSVGQVHHEFMNSPGHRANILRSGINVAGFGVAYDSAGTMYTVERFYACRSVATPQSTSGAIRGKWLAMGGAPVLGRYQGTRPAWPPATPSTGPASSRRGAPTFEFRYLAEYKPTGQTFVCTYQGACG